MTGYVYYTTNASSALNISSLAQWINNKGVWLSDITYKVNNGEQNYDPFWLNPGESARHETTRSSATGLKSKNWDGNNGGVLIVFRVSNGGSSSVGWDVICRSNSWIKS